MININNAVDQTPKRHPFAHQD